MKKSPTTVTVRSGQLEFVKVNTIRLDWRDIYHQLVTLTWPRFLLFLSGVYVAINCLFALLYYLGGDCIAELPHGSLTATFFFSVETLATVGYGHMYPATLYGHLMVTAEIMVGTFGTAVMTGLIFVRFSRPTARIEFSNKLVVAPFDGQPALMLRVANLRHHAMVEAEFRMVLLRNEVIKEDPSMRRFHSLKLLVDHVITFPAVLTMRHIIDESSPLHGMTPESMERSDARVVASVVCVDSVIQAPLQSQQDYSWREILFGQRFVEGLQRGPRWPVDGRLRSAQRHGAGAGKPVSRAGRPGELRTGRDLFIKPVAENRPRLLSIWRGRPPARFSIHL